jgi:hypothetical protein
MGRDRRSPQHHTGGIEFSALWQLVRRVLVSTYTDLASLQICLIKHSETGELPYGVLSRCPADINRSG